MMQNKKIIAITGNIASGKSSVSDKLREKGFEVIDFDEVSHQIYKKGEKTYYKLIEEFGEEILSSDGEIDRKKLAKIVFSSRKLLKKLEELTHTDIILRVINQIGSVKSSVIFLEISLYLETKELIESHIDIDEKWDVISDKDIRIKRVMQRDDVDFDMAMKKINSQYDYQTLTTDFDEVIINNGSKSELMHRIDELIDRKKL